jgi:hypothetical protein
MDEFKNKSKDELNKFLHALNAYKQGCIDTFVLIQEQHIRTIDFYDKKINSCKKYIEALAGTIGGVINEK